MRIRKAVIPAAGFGTRVFPASRAVSKELFPVVGPDGVCRAAVHYGVAELAAAGVEEICIVVRPGDEIGFSVYFSPPSDRLRRRLRPEQEALSEELADLGERIRFAFQASQEGFGHAVYCAREFVGDGPFLLLLGDHVFRAPACEPSCCEQMIAVQARYGGNVTAVNRLPEAELRSFGAIAGRRLPDDPDVIDVTEFREKPEPEYARRRLRVEGLTEGEYLCHFGIHAFTPGVFEQLARMMAEGLRDRGEIQMTTAQSLLAEREPYHAYEIRGERFDLGLPEEYVRTVTAMAGDARGDSRRNP